MKEFNFRSIIELPTNESLTIKEVFKGTANGFDMSDVILEQIKYVSKNPTKLKNILLDNVVNDEILNALKTKGQKYVIDNWGKIGGLDGMTRKILEKTGKSVSEIKIYKEKDPYYPDLYIYDIQINIK